MANDTKAYMQMRGAKPVDSMGVSSSGGAAKSRRMQGQPTPPQNSRGRMNAGFKPENRVPTGGPREIGNPNAKAAQAAALRRRVGAGAGGGQLGAVSAKFGGGSTMGRAQNFMDEFKAAKGAMGGGPTPAGKDLPPRPSPINAGGPKRGPLGQTLGVATGAPQGKLVAGAAGAMKPPTVAPTKPAVKGGGLAGLGVQTQAPPSTAPLASARSAMPAPRPVGTAVTGGGVGGGGGGGQQNAMRGRTMNQ